MLNELLPAPEVVTVAAPEMSFAPRPIAVDCESTFAAMFMLVVAKGGDVVVDRLMSAMVPVMTPKVSAWKPWSFNPSGFTTSPFLLTLNWPARV